MRLLLLVALVAALAAAPAARAVSTFEAHALQGACDSNRKAPVTLVDRLPGGSSPCCGGMVCPIAGGICCEGGSHCCPSGTKCLRLRDGEGQKCSPSGLHANEKPPSPEGKAKPKRVRAEPVPPFHIQLTQARSMKQMSRKQLANAVGVTEHQILQFELGEEVPSPEVTGRLARTLQVNFVPVASANGEEEPENYKPGPQLRPVAEAIADAREARGMTQKALAAAIGVTEAAVVGFETDSTAPPSKNDVRRIEAVLSVDLPDPNLPAKAPGVDLTKLLPKLRQDKGLSVASLSKRIGVPASVVRGMENGKIVPTTQLRARLDKVLGTSIEQATKPVQDLTVGVTLSKERVPQGSPKGPGAKADGAAVGGSNPGAAGAGAGNILDEEDRQAFTKDTARKAAEMLAQEKAAAKAAAASGSESSSSSSGDSSSSSSGDDDDKAEQTEEQKKDQKVGEVVAGKKAADEKEAAAANALNSRTAAQQAAKEAARRESAKKVMAEAAAAAKKADEAEAKAAAAKNDAKKQAALAAANLAREKARAKAEAHAAQAMAASAGREDFKSAKQKAAEQAAAANAAAAAMMAGASKKKANSDADKAKEAAARARAQVLSAKPVEMRLSAASEICVATTAAKAAAGVAVTVEVCSRARHQWRMGSDKTFRPSHNADLCMEARGRHLVLAACQPGRPSQQFDRRGLTLVHRSMCVGRWGALVRGSRVILGRCSGHPVRLDLVDKKAARTTPAARWIVLNPASSSVRRCVEAHTRGARLVTCEAKNALSRWARYPDGSVRPVGDAARCLDAAEGAGTQPRIVACVAGSKAQGWSVHRNGHHRAWNGFSLALKSTKPKAGDPLTLVKASAKSPPAGLHWRPVGAKVDAAKK